jgi:hypothetical protein
MKLKLVAAISALAIPALAHAQQSGPQPKPIEAEAQQLAQDRDRRQNLYKQFINEASRMRLAFASVAVPRLTHPQRENELARCSISSRDTLYFWNVFSFSTGPAALFAEKQRPQRQAGAKLV